MPQTINSPRRTRTLTGSDTGEHTTPRSRAPTDEEKERKPHERQARLPCSRCGRLETPSAFLSIANPRTQEPFDVCRQCVRTIVEAVVVFGVGQ
jgi:ribosomal protein S14